MKKFILLTLPAVLLLTVFYFYYLSGKETTETNNRKEEIKSETKSGFKFKKTLTELTPEEFMRIYNELQQLHPDGNGDDTGDWVNLGPYGFRINNDPTKLYSGKVTNIYIEGTNIFLGAANGGIWRNIFITWGPVSERLPTQQIGALAVKPGTDNVILAGTGELFNGGGSGFGLFKTTDGGLNWSMKNMTGSLEPSGFSRLAFSRQGSDTVHAATNLGYFRSTNQGETWTRFNIDLNPQRVISDLRIDPFNSRILYSVVNRDSVGGGGIYKSTNAGMNWVKAGGIPDSNGNGAISICDSFNQILFSYLTKANTGGALGIYRSTNSGQNWTMLTVPQNFLDALGTQGFHAYACTVSPTNPNIILVGGVKLIRTSNGGLNWNTVGDIHDDIQNFEWINGNVYAACDGGIYFSSNSGLNWSTSGNNMPITEFNSISLATGAPLELLAGAEHNGIAHFKETGGNSIWYYRFGQDGGCTAIDPNDRNFMYAINGVILNSPMPFYRNRSTDGGLSWNAIENGIQLSDACGQWYPSIKSDRVISPGTNSLYAQVCKTVYKSTNRGMSWFDLVCPLKNTNLFIDEHITASRYGDVYAVSTNALPVQSSKLYAYYSSSGTWSDMTPLFSVPNRLKRVSVDPVNDSVIFAVYQGINNPTIKVVKSTNRGLNWTNITGTGLGDAPMLEVLKHPSNGNLLYAATERFGMFFTSNGGQSWHPWNHGLPNGVIIADIEIIDSTASSPMAPIMFMSTYGRGVYFKLLDGDPVIGVGNITENAEGFSLQQNYPNPFNPVTKIKFTIPHESIKFSTGGRNTVLKIFDATGRETATLVNNYLPAGEYTVEWNASSYPSGVYYYTLRTGQNKQTRKMILLK